MQFSLYIALIGNVKTQEIDAIKDDFGFVKYEKFNCCDSQLINYFDIVICEKHQMYSSDLLGKCRVRCVLCEDNKSLIFSGGKIDYSSQGLYYILRELILTLDRIPFITSESLMNIVFCNEIEVKDEIQNKEQNKGDLQNVTAAFIVVGKDLNFSRNLLRYSDKKIQAYYDIKKECFIDRQNRESKVEYRTVYAINTLQSPANKSGIEYRFPNSQILYYGKFGEFENYEKLYYKNQTEEVNTPTVMISSFGPEMGKFDILCTINQQFKNNCISTECVSSNPCAELITNIRYIEYPENQFYLDIVKKIKEIMSDIDKNDNELAIWDVPGGCIPIDNLRTDYGGLTFAFLSAIKNVDACILCFNKQINKELIQRQCQIFELLGVSKVILVQSNTSYLRTMIGEGKLSVYEHKEDEKQDIFGYPIFNISEVYEGKLYDYLFSLFTQ